MNRHEMKLFALALLLCVFSAYARAAENQGPQFGTRQLSPGVSETDCGGNVADAMVRNDVPAQVADQVHALLLGLEGSAEGKAILGGMETARFLLSRPVPIAEMTYLL
jgi:hypothetical protein